MEQPHNLEAEEALLSAVFSGANPKYIDVSEGDFYTQRNADLWRAIRIVCSNGMDIDIVTISDELRKMGVYADVGGDAFLMDISMRFGLYGSVESYANIIREMSRRRKMIATAQRMANSAFDLTVQPDRIASEAMTEIANSANTTDGATHISEYLSVLYDKVTDATENPCDVPGLSFGMSDMDEVTLGAQTGTQMNIGGEPGIGKTTLAFQWAVSFGNQQPGAIFSMEMSGVSALRRVVSNESGVTPRKMITGRFADADHAGFVGAIDRLSQLPVYMSDSTRWTSQTMRSELARLKQRYEIKWFLLDYFDQLKDGAENTNERDKIISRNIHDAIKDLDLFGMVIVPLNKTGLNGNDGQGGFAGSVQRMYDADLAIILTNGGENIVNLEWKKNREGIGRKIALTRKPDFPTFVQAELSKIAPAREWSAKR